ncbi:MAG TPA: hypothetical protein VFM99_08490, partial [Chitinophagales bacterium]|nr:hypothetical protein [Chitinophagales bacterium]
MKNSITLLASCFFCIINITAQELPCTLSPSLSSDWSCLGPFEYEESKQGKIVAIWADPGSINTLYAGTGSSGLWKTSDGGSNWENLFSFELAGVGVQEIEQAEVFVEGPSFTTYAIYGSTMFEGSNMSRFGIGLVYYEPFNGTWQKEAESNFPVGFSFELHKDYFGGFALAYQQGLKKLWVGNSKKIFIRNTYRNYAAPHYTWLPDPVFDFAIHGDATGSKQSVREIDFAPADNSIVVISPNGGRQYDFLISLNASSAVPTWQSLPLPPFPLTTPAGTGDYFRFEATTFFLDNDIFYSVFKVAVFTNVSDDYPIYTSCYLGLYDLSGPSPVLTKYHQLINNTLSNSLGDRPRGGFTDLIVFPDNDDEFFVGDNQDGLQKGVIPLSGDINMFRVSTLNPGFEIENTHTDIRSMDFYYSSPSSKIIYIATDGGVSKCDNVSALLNSDDANDDIWQNINGYGFTMTEFVGFSNSEFDKYRIIAAAPDGNSFIYKNDGTDNYQFYSLSRGDAYNASLSKTNFDKAIHNSNGGGPDLASEFNRVDLNAVSWSSPGISEIPRADPDPECTPAECANGTCPNVDECLEYNIGLKPFDFEIDLGQEFLWVGTDDLFRNPKALTTPYLQSDYEQMSKAHVSNDDNPLVAASDKTTRAITSYKRVDRSAGDDIIIDMYFTTQKEWQPTNPGYPDAVKIVKAQYKKVDDVESFPSESITPLTIIDEAPGYSHFDYAYITDIEVDASDPDASNTEIWVCFGANFQGENLLATALGPDNNGIKAKVYYSPDDGETWFNRSAGLPDYPVICLEYWKGSDDIIFAGTNVGVYIWNKAEEIWECFNTDNQMPYASVNDLEINYCTMSLRACTQGYALWE